MLNTFSSRCFQIYQNKWVEIIGIYFIGTIVLRKYMPIISAVGLFWCNKFEETPNEKVVNMSKLTKSYFNNRKIFHRQIIVQFFCYFKKALWFWWFLYKNLTKLIDVWNLFAILKSYTIRPFPRHFVGSFLQNFYWMFTLNGRPVGEYKGLNICAWEF